MTTRVVMVSPDERPNAWEAACAFALVDCGAEIVARVVMHVPARRRLGRHLLRSEAPGLFPSERGEVAQLRDAAAARSYAPDVAVALDERLADAAKSAGARSTWWFAFGASAAADPAGAREMARGAGAIFAALVSDNGGAPACIKRGWFGVSAHSYADTIDAARFAAAHWPAGVLRQREQGLAERTTPLSARSDGDPDPRARVSSTALEAKLAFAAIAARFRYLFRHEHWNVGVASRPIASFVEQPTTDDVRWMRWPPRGSFVADPFGCEKDGATYVFCEGFDYRDKVGYLASGMLDDTGIEGVRLAPFYRPPTHCSYPFVVQDGGQTYCIPETSQAGDVALWRALELPARWERVATLLERFPGCDPTVIRHDGSWWMFCTHGDMPNHALHVFHAQDLLGPWRPHARNPVKLDVRSARPAGTPFVHGGALYRPAQDCAGAYGRRVVLNRVLALTPYEFEEEPVVAVAPAPAGPYRAGVHTLSGVGPFTLIDGKYFRFVPSECWSVLRGYAARMLGRVRA